MRKLDLILSLGAFVLATLLPSQLSAQKYVDATKLTIIGKAMETPANPYHRLDTIRYNNIASEPTAQFIRSAGIAVTFRTNSTEISAKWVTTKRTPSTNMTAIAQKGLDLYIKRDGQWVFAGVATPKLAQHNAVIVKTMDDSMKECLLYLPLFDQVTSLEIGVNDNAIIEPGKVPFRKKIVIYGSSIAHGASASRSGMTYPAILCRQTGLNFINMAVSGEGKMQPGIAPMLSDTNPDAYILDCMPNPSPQQIRERTIPFVKYLREHHPNTPIIFIQTLVRETTNFNLRTQAYEAQKRQAAKDMVEALQKEGIAKFYFIDEDQFLGSDHNATSDGTHPNDLGFDRMLSKIRPQIMHILKENGIE